MIRFIKLFIKCWKDVCEHEKKMNEFSKGMKTHIYKDENGQNVYCFTRVPKDFVFTPRKTLEDLGENKGLLYTIKSEENEKNNCNSIDGSCK